MSRSPGAWPSTRSKPAMRRSEEVTSVLLSGLRILRREPLHAALSIVPLVIGTAAATAIFAVIFGVLFRPLPYGDADSMVSIAEAQPGRSGQSTVASANLERLSRANTFGPVSAFSYSEY